MQMPDEVSKGQVLEGSGWLIKFGGSRCRWPMKFRMVPVQIADKVAELSSSGGLRYKNLPRSSKLLGITHEFIFVLLSCCRAIFCDMSIYVRTRPIILQSHYVSFFFPLRKWCSFSLSFLLLSRFSRQEESKIRPQKVTTIAGQRTIG